MGLGITECMIISGAIYRSSATRKWSPVSRLAINSFIILISLESRLLSNQTVTARPHDISASQPHVQYHAAACRSECQDEVTVCCVWVIRLISQSMPAHLAAIPTSPSSVATSLVMVPVFLSLSITHPVFLSAVITFSKSRSTRFVVFEINCNLSSFNSTPTPPILLTPNSSRLPVLSR